jgi:hypothetical protein
MIVAYFLVSYAGLTRVSIFFAKRMDCRVKPGNDDLFA